MPLWAFALFCVIAISGWGFGATFYGMYRIEKRLLGEWQAAWGKIAAKYGLEPPPSPRIQLVKPPEFKS